MIDRRPVFQGIYSLEVIEDLRHTGTRVYLIDRAVDATDQDFHADVWGELEERRVRTD